jgi:hypothetical protein
MILSSKSNYVKRYLYKYGLDIFLWFRVKRVC